MSCFDKISVFIKSGYIYADSVSDNSRGLNLDDPVWPQFAGSVRGAIGIDLVNQ